MNITVEQLATMVDNDKINPQETQYLMMMAGIKNNGQVKTDRTGTGTRSTFGQMMRFNLQEGFPLLSTKKLHLRSIIHELIWFLNGDTNIQYLKDNGVSIWDEWAGPDGELGPVYGQQWRRWNDTKIMHPINDAAKIEQMQKNGYVHMGDTTYRGVAGKMAVLVKEYDQISEALSLIKNNPDSRRIIVSGWNVGDVPEVKLPPCHTLFQFYVSDLTVIERMQLAVKEGKLTAEEIDQVTRLTAFTHEDMDLHGIPRKKLSCMLYARSQDTFLGTPFNIASYALLTHMFAQQADMAVGEFIWIGGDTHVYSNHLEQVDQQLARTVKALPQLVIKRRPASIFDYKFDDFEITGYDPHPAIKAPVAV